MIVKQVILSRLLDCHLLHPNSDQTSLQLDILEHRQCISSNIFQGLVLFVDFESDVGNMINRRYNTVYRNFRCEDKNLVYESYHNHTIKFLAFGYH